MAFGEADACTRVASMSPRGGSNSCHMRIPAMMTGRSAEGDRFAHPFLTGVGFLLGPVTFRQGRGHSSPHGFPPQNDAMGAVKEPIEDRIGQRGLADVLMPVIRRELASD
jgi:hypothetical protein